MPFSKSYLLNNNWFANIVQLLVGVLYEIDKSPHRCLSVIYLRNLRLGCNHLWGVVWLACTTAGIQIIILLFAFMVFSFLPNRNTPPTNFWQRIPHTVGCIPANKLSSLRAFRAPLPCSILPPGTLSSKFWQWIPLPICKINTGIRPCSNYPVCWADSVWYSRFTQYNHQEVPLAAVVRVPSP